MDLFNLLGYKSPLDIIWFHICHILHYEIKSSSVWPIWKPIPIRFFKSQQNFQTMLQDILWRNKHKSHFVVFITSFLHLNKGFWLFLGSFKVIFVKIAHNFIKSPFDLSNGFQATAYGMYEVKVVLSYNFWWHRRITLCHKNTFHI